MQLQSSNAPSQPFTWGARRVSRSTVETDFQRQSTDSNSKRTGLDKAIHQIEEAIKRSKGDSVDLKRLLDVANTRSTPFSNGDDASAVRPSLVGQVDNEQLEYDDIENPLQLLARASDLQLASPQGSASQHATPKTPQTTGAGKQGDVNQFFMPLRATMDVHGPQITDCDPIELGLVTTEEARALVAFFHDNLAHTRWGFDPVLHTFEFVRAQSAFLLTSMLAASALFTSAAGALAKRLERHRDWLATQVISKRLRSVEIVLAFLLNIPWMHPGQHAADDDTGLYISTALTIAMDLSLNKIVLPSSWLSRELENRISRADCIDAQKALAMDGFENVPPESQWGQRLFCRRERAWIALFVLERGVCLARGRNYCVPITPLIRYCDNWLAHPMTHGGDGAMLSMSILRRNLDDLFDAVRARCDSYRVIDVGSKVAEEIESTINHFYERWFTTWTTAIGQGQQQSLPPYVEILVTHTRLSTYGGVINHPTAPLEVKRLFRASALSSAINVMRVAIQGEKALSSMPNNTVIMICFAACVALQLSASPGNTTSQLGPSILNLVDETSAVLARIGKITPHRNGASTMYSKYLSEVMQQFSSHTQVVDAAISVPMTQQVPANVEIAAFEHEPAVQQQYPMQAGWMEPLQFSAMSDHQILESVLNAEPDFNAMMPDLPVANADYAWMNFMNPPDFGF